ncbi:superoxide dismutase family protein [Paenibacillus nanensis]|uniref:Superoxide dismutase [Cu-Zn] n=1 Tax=Paenibacillus nanensis TaxID=393251 RepID=A0A3A1UQF5_9BACL|nr:superoxide dismutase family protein [Paenibacillus nanensis]RIX48766.1 superoxide dismutase family protein [Paenibacillus nanensis]
MKKIAVLSAALLLAGSLGVNSARAEEGTSPSEMLVPIINSKGEQIGRAQLMQQGEKVVIGVEAQGLPPGTHAIHIHTEGKCDTPDFTSAGPHFNPHDKQHGFKNPKGFHSGDLPNIEVKSDGTLKVKLESAAVTLKPGKPNSLLKSGGTSLIIHEKKDDYVTDPAGNAGARIACGVIK